MAALTGPTAQSALAVMRVAAVGAVAASSASCFKSSVMAVALSRAAVGAAAGEKRAAVEEEMEQEEMAESNDEDDDGDLPVQKLFGTPIPEAMEEAVNATNAASQLDSTIADGGRLSPTALADEMPVEGATAATVKMLQQQLEQQKTQNDELRVQVGVCVHAVFS